MKLPEDVIETLRIIKGFFALKNSIVLKGSHVYAYETKREKKPDLIIISQLEKLITGTSFLA